MSTKSAVIEFRCRGTPWGRKIATNNFGIREMSDTISAPAPTATAKSGTSGAYNTSAEAQWIHSALGRPSPDHPSRDDQVATRWPFIRTPEVALPPLGASHYHMLLRFSHWEQTSRSRQLRTGISAPYRWAISAGSGST
jgi:hypothetical protein